MRNAKLDKFRQIHDFIESMDHSIECLHHLKQQVDGRTVLNPRDTSAFLTYLDTQLATLEAIRDGTVSRTAQMIELNSEARRNPRAVSSYGCVASVTWISSLG
jgi:hypothetical protein